MTSPQISFRLTPHQLARGLKILRSIEPNHQPASLSQLIKTLYLNQIAHSKTVSSTIITDADIAEIHNLAKTKQKNMSFKDFQSITTEPAN